MSPAQEPAIALAEVGLMVTNCNTGALLPQAVKAKMHTNAVTSKAKWLGILLMTPPQRRKEETIDQRAGLDDLNIEFWAVDDVTVGEVPTPKPVVGIPSASVREARYLNQAGAAKYLGRYP